ncbi:hypothetical protein SAMN02745130_03159 [Thiothrix eikelboomii]|uniref:Uncharacterized protein n=1 Tax=Thiothrix eikelboomii TaxID=92487 RepID=A0A1T4XN92_9GAMM|nr:hypothetical protein SAMN02745130_03159 [Thiothrix eikelboomii]
MLYFRSKAAGSLTQLCYAIEHFPPRRIFSCQIQVFLMQGRDLDKLKELPVDEIADHLVMHVDRL